MQTKEGVGGEKKKKAAKGAKLKESNAGSKQLLWEGHKGNRVSGRMKQMASTWTS